MPTGSTSRRSGTAAGRRSGGAPTRSSSRSWSSTTRRSVSHRHGRHGHAPGEKKKPTTRSPASRTRRCGSASSARLAGRCSGPISPTIRADSFLISDVGWWPDSSAAYCYVQNRTQTWLDLVKFTPGATERLGQAAVPRFDQGLDREPGADPLAGRRHVPLAQRARRLEASLPLRRRRHA